MKQFPERLRRSWPSTAHLPEIVPGFITLQRIVASPPSLVIRSTSASRSPETRPEKSEFGGKTAIFNSSTPKFTGTRCPFAPSRSLPRASTSSQGAVKERFSSGSSFQGVAWPSCRDLDRTWRQSLRRTRLSSSRQKTTSSRSSRPIWKMTRWSRDCQRKPKIQV